MKEQLILHHRHLLQVKEKAYNDEIGKIETALEKYKDNEEKLKEYEDKKYTLEYSIQNEKDALAYLENLDLKEEVTTLSAASRQSIFDALDAISKDCHNPNTVENFVVIQTEVKESIHDYVVLDLETTGFSSLTDKIIDIGILKVRNDKIVDKYEQLVDPHVELPETIIDLTGIHDLMLIGQPDILEVFDDVIKFIGNDIIVGHNVNFDIGFLNNVKEDYIFRNNYLDTVNLARKAFPELKHHRLEDLVAYLGLSPNAHRALADCIATKELYDCVLEKHGSVEAAYAYIPVIKKPKGIDIESFSENKESPLYDRNCIITGNPSKMDKLKAYAIIERIGGHISKSLNKKTNYLIVGGFDNIKNMTGTKSSKMIKAEQMILAGQDLKIISEKEFYDIIGL